MILNREFAKSIILNHLKGKVFNKGHDIIFNASKLQIGSIDSYTIGRICRKLEKEGWLVQVNGKNATKKSYKTRIDRDGKEKILF